ncbi:hypothetical protein EC588_23790 [Klebsiella quasipneumoniae subsp. similipneumoniae]|nr:hypothetical protein EC588_23790 [Klebsiella quasipneumoniae subsp. similipneumoniae]
MKPVMTRAEGCFTVFGRIGVMPGRERAARNLTWYTPVTLSEFMQRNLMKVIRLESILLSKNREYIA